MSPQIARPILPFLAGLCSYWPFANRPTSEREATMSAVTRFRSYGIGPLAICKSWCRVLALLGEKTSVLARLLKPELLSPTVVSSPRPQPSSPTIVPDCGPEQAPRTGRPKRRVRRVPIARLYPERPLEPLLHARALIEIVREECPDFVGRYIPKSDLERTYHELCAAEGWSPRH
jgi:hypothetical protein